MNDDKLRIIKSKSNDKELIKIANNINSIFSQKENNNKSKEIIRKMILNLIEDKNFPMKQFLK